MMRGLRGVGVGGAMVLREPEGEDGRGERRSFFFFGAGECRRLTGEKDRGRKGLGQLVVRRGLREEGRESTKKFKSRSSLFTF